MGHMRLALSEEDRLEMTNFRVIRDKAVCVLMVPFIRSTRKACLCPFER